MNTFGSGPTANNTFSTQTTPVNQNRTGNGFLLNSTAIQPSALTSTPFGSPSLFGGPTLGASTPLSASSGTGTVHKFAPTVGTDKVNKNGLPTTIATKLFNICAMSVYEKKSMEELRLEDYVDNRKTSSATTNTATGLFAAPAATPSLFGAPAAATTNPTTLASSLFGTPATTSGSTLTSNLFANRPATTTATASPFAFGAPTATTSATTTPFAFGSSATSTANPTSAFGAQAPATAPVTSISPFTFGGAQPAAATTTAAAPAFAFGSATTSAGTSFGFSVPKTTAAGTFSFAPVATTSAAPTFSLFPTTTTAATAAPALFSAPAVQPVVINNPSSVDTRTHLQLFQTMLNIQPFNSEHAFLARNIKPNIGLDRARLRTAPDSSTVNPLNNLFSPLLAKPSVLTSNTSTPPSSLVHPLPSHSHTLPSVLLPTTNASTSIALFGKRKLADSFLDDDDNNSLMMDDGPSTGINKIVKANAIKRPRVLDMNKIRSVVLGGGGGGGGSIVETSAKEEQFSETFVVKTTSDNLSGWKKFATYDAYLASKRPTIENDEIILEEKVQILPEKKFEQERAFRLPRLTHDDYYTKPTIDELRHYFNEQGQCLVKEFTVGREHYGSVKFQGSKINLAGLDLNQLIEIGRRQVTVYPDDKNKPIEGEELNCQAIISLLGVYPIDRSISNSGGEEVTDPDRLIDINYSNYLREMTKKFQGKFIDYDVYTGTWTFKVEHF